MKLDLFLLAAQPPGWSQAEALAHALDLATAAEGAGLDGVWLAEHHFISYGVCPSAVAFAAHLLGRTRRVAVGTAVAILANRHPVALAEEAALLDHLSGGRFRLGVGRGGPWVDLEVFGTGLARFERGFAESLDLLLAWLTRDRLGAGGEFFGFREVAVVPRPVTRPHPPVIVAATSPGTVEVAAARGLPVLLGLHEDDQTRAGLLARYAEAAERHGRDPGAVEHATAMVAHVADDRAQSVGRLRAAMPPWLERGVGEYVSLIPGRPRRDARAYVEDLLATSAIGTPAQCAERLAATAERTGIRRFLLMVEGAGEQALDTVARLGAEVLPLVR